MTEYKDYLENRYCGLPNICVSHIDLDGYGCNILMKATYPTVEMHNVNYDELESKLKELPKDINLTITDLSFKEDMRELLESFEVVNIIDHHETTQWINERPLKNAGFTIVDSSHSATYWLGEHIKKTNANGRISWIDSWVKYIDDYDMWVKKYPESDRLNALLYISSRDYFVDSATKYDADRVLSYNKERIDKYLAQLRQYVEETPVYEIAPNVKLAFAEKYKSHIADYHFKKGDCELMFIADAHYNMLSIRSAVNSDIDCSKIAENHFNGGGHIHASGGEIKNIFAIADDIKKALGV